MKIIYSRRALSFDRITNKFKYPPQKVETYCIEDTMNREFLAPKQVFLIATKSKKNFYRIYNHLIRDFSEETANIGDNFYFCQVRNYDELIEAISRFTNKMNIIPIYFDKDDKTIQKFIDEEIQNESFLKMCKFIFCKVDYKNEDYNIFVMNELNKMDCRELASEIFCSRQPVKWEEKWNQIVSENPDYFNKQGIK